MDYKKIEIQLFVLACLLIKSCALVLPPYEDEVPENTLWHPPEDSTVKTREEWLRTHGLGDQVFTQLKEKIELIATKQTDAGLLPKDANFTHTTHKDETLDGCIKLSEEQADLILKEAEYEKEHNTTGVRRKRKLYDFRSNPARKWSMPIRIMFDGQHSDYEKHIIRAAFKHWEEGTCIRFEEIPTNTPVQGQYVLITRQPEGCFTFVGKTSIVPQQFNLEYNCLWEFGIPVHEIGHILGLWHEHQREDRDAFIKINWDNLGYYESQFYKINTLRLGQTYDYSSVMHYSSKEGSKNGKVTIEATDRRFQSNMGQRIAASFIDKKMINLEYCKDRCYGPSPPCQRDGYQDPNNCYNCICPDGFAGPFCQYVDSYKGQVACGGLVNLNSFREIIIQSPGYERGYYNEGQACNWLLKAPAGFRPVMRFEGEFGVYCHLHEQCYHWVEVRTDENLGANGGRYCCYETPRTEFKAKTDEMLITFRSNYSSRWTPASRGFRMIISTERVFNNPADRRPVRNPVETYNGNEADHYNPAPPSYPAPAPAPPSPPFDGQPSHFGRPNYPDGNSFGTPKPSDPNPPPYPTPYPDNEPPPSPIPNPRSSGSRNQNNNRDSRSNFGTPIPGPIGPYNTPSPLREGIDPPQNPENEPHNKYLPQVPQPAPYRPEIISPPKPTPSPYKPETPAPYKPETPGSFNFPTVRPPVPDNERADPPLPYRPETARPPNPDVEWRNTPIPYRPETARPPNPDVERRNTPIPYRPETARPPNPDVERRNTPIPYRPETARPPNPDVERPNTPAPYKPETARPRNPDISPDRETGRPDPPSPFRFETAIPRQLDTDQPETQAPYIFDTAIPPKPDTNMPDTPIHERPDSYNPEGFITPEGPNHNRPITPSPFRPDPDYISEAPSDIPETLAPYVPPNAPPSPYDPPASPPTASPNSPPYTPTQNTESSEGSSISRFPSRAGENTIPPITSTLPRCLVGDIALVLDASGSMNINQYRKVKKFCSDLIDELNIGIETVRLGVMTFANRAVIEADLQKYLRKIDLQYAVNVTSWKREWTNTSGALMTLTEEMFTLERGDRMSRPNIALMIIGGPSNLWAEKTQREAKLARNAGIELYVIGVTDRVDSEELEGIAGDSRNVLEVGTYDELLLPETSQQILYMMCNNGDPPRGSRLISEPDTTSGSTERSIPKYKWECSFEPEQDWCGIRQVTYDNFDWTRYTGPTPSAGTGPKEAYNGLYYIYIEATDQKPQEQAIFMIPKVMQNGPYCLSFHYFMKGYNVGTLQVFIERPGQPRDYPITLSGHKGADWYFKQVEVEVGRDDQIGFRGVRGGGYLSDIALDEIKLEAGGC